MVEEIIYLFFLYRTLLIIERFCRGNPLWLPICTAEIGQPQGIAPTKSFNNQKYTVKNLLSMMNSKITTIILFFALSLIIQNCSVSKEEAWPIKKGQLISTESKEAEKAKAYWDYACKILPKEVLHKYVTSIKLFTDGKEEALAGMAPLNEVNTAWEFDIDTIDYNLNNKDSLHMLSFNHALIHEFAHILTLNPEQVTITRDKVEDERLGYLTQEGYATNSSYLGQFVHQFWPKSLLSKWDKIQRVSRENRKIDLLYDFYLDHQEHFVTGYAAESPEEDIAESWVFFILTEKKELPTIKYKKILFFYQFPKLIDYRNRIRKQLPFIPLNYLENYKESSYHD